MCYWLTRYPQRYIKLQSCIAHVERPEWWDSVAFHIVSYINFHSSSHSSFTLNPPSVSYFCVTVPSGLVSRSSICQHHPGGWQSGWGPGERHQTWDAGLGPPTPPPHPISIWVAAPPDLSAHDLELAVAGEKERPTAIDKWQSQNKHTSEGGEEKKSWITLSSSVSLCWSSH